MDVSYFKKFNDINNFKLIHNYDPHLLTNCKKKDFLKQYIFYNYIFKFIEDILKYNLPSRPKLVKNARNIKSIQ